MPNPNVIERFQEIVRGQRPVPFLVQEDHRPDLGIITIGEETGLIFDHMPGTLERVSQDTPEDSLEELTKQRDRLASWLIYYDDVLEGRRIRREKLTREGPLRPE